MKRPIAPRSRRMWGGWTPIIIWLMPGPIMGSGCIPPIPGIIIICCFCMCGSCIEGSNDNCEWCGGWW